MNSIVWEVIYTSSPHVIRYCKKCGKKTEYKCSDLFRVNAQKKSIDIWLIYKCIHCDNTWNLTLYSRIPPQILAPELLHSFHQNQEELAMEYACNTDILLRNKVEPCEPQYQIIGHNPPFGIPTELSITCRFPCSIRISSILRQKLGLSLKELNHWIETGLIQALSNIDIKKSKLQTDVTLLLSNDCSPTTSLYM